MISHADLPSVARAALRSEKRALTYDLTALKSISSFKLGSAWGPFVAISAACIWSQRRPSDPAGDKIKQCRRVATRYDKLAALAFVKLASIRSWRRADESAP